jgi:protein-tyrosine phosphatase
MRFERLSGYHGLAVAGLCLAVWTGCEAQPPHDKGTSTIPFEAADVASPDGRVFVVSWRAPRIHAVRIFAGTDPAHVDTDHPVAKGAGNGEVTLSTLPSAPRWYFELRPDHGEPLVVADRSLHLTTAANFRDAGGYRTADGKWIRMGLVYRSNGIEHLTDDELAEIERLKIKLVCDLRTAEEIRRNPDRVPPGITAVSADVLADDADLIHAMIAGAGTGTAPAALQTPAANPQSAGGSAAPDLQLRIYRDFVRLASARKAYRSLFERLADPAALPTVFHCTAGKDRTGWAQAVLLTILGVPRTTIVRDYELTNDYLQGDALKSVRQSTSQATTSVRLRADPKALDAAFDEVMQDYGSFDNYLRQGLQLSDYTLAAIRGNFLTG